MDFDDFTQNDNNKSTNAENTASESIDIHVKQRNGRKRITTVEGLGNDKDNLKSISKELRKKMSCSGSVNSNDDGEYFIKFSGKNTAVIIQYLMEKLHYKREQIHVHGEVG
jgi:translation initiation factor 1